MLMGVFTEDVFFQNAFVHGENVLNGHEESSDECLLYDSDQ